MGVVDDDKDFDEEAERIEEEIEEPVHSAGKKPPEIPDDEGNEGEDEKGTEDK